MSASEHLSEQDLERYLRRAMTGPELLASDDHLAQCDSCSGRLQERDEARGALFSVTAAFQEALARPEHPPYQQLAAYVDSELSSGDREGLEAHLQECPQCASETQDLRSLQAELSPGVSPARTPSAWRRILALWGMPAFRMPVRVAAMAAGVALAGWLVSLAVRQPVEDRAARPTVPITAPKVPDPHEVLVALDDGAGRVVLDRQGRLHGLASRDRTHEAAVRAALSAQRVAAPPLLRELAGAAGTLMGVPEGSEVFRLLSPLATAVLEDRPIFRWRRHPAARAYDVTVYGSGFRRVAAGRSLSATEWRPAQPLPRGQVLLWQVRTLVGDKEVVAPPPAAPEAKFKVLEQAQADELANLRQTYAGSHLMLGALYAEAGLLEEAERELQSLLEANPESPVAEKLLASVKALRR